MKKFLIALSCTLLLALSAFGLFGCGGDPETPNPETPKTYDYQVTVECEDTIDLSGIKVRLFQEGELKAEAPLEGKVAKFSLEGGAYHVKLTGVPEAYTYEEADITTTIPAVTLTLTLKDDKPADGLLDFTVTLLYPDGSPVENATIQLCVEGTDGACYPLTTDTNGVATRRLAPMDYHVKPLALPEGYKFEEEYYTIDSLQSTAITITLVAA